MSLINSTRVLTSTQSLDEVLQLLIEEVLSVFEWADASVLFLSDNQKRYLTAKSAVGFDMNYLSQIRLNIDEGMSGKTFSLKKPQLFTSSNDTEKGMADLTKANMDYYRKALGENHMVPTSTISAPLIHKEECFGVLTIDSFSNDMRFTQEDLLLLQTFANQAMIAIENAILISQNERAQHLYERLTESYMTQRGLEQITQTLSELIHAEVGVINDFYTILSFTSNRVKEVIDASAKEFPTETLSYFQEEVRYDEEFYDLYYFPIKIKYDAVGMLMVLTEKETLLDALDLFAIAQATTVFALELQSQSQFISGQFNEERVLIKEILKETESGESLLKKKGLYHKANRYFTVSFEISHETGGQEHVQIMKTKFSTSLFHSLKLLPYKVLVYENSLRYSLLVISKESTEKTNMRIVEWVKGFQKAMDMEIIGGEGRSFLDLIDLQLSLNDSYKVLEYLKQTEYERGTFLSYSELGVYRLFLNISKEEIGSYVALYLDNLLEYDKNHHMNLVYTLESYMESKFNVSKTSKKLFVHENTVKYRINKIKELLGVELLEGEVGLQIHLALKAHAYIRTMYLSE